MKSYTETIASWIYYAVVLYLCIMIPGCILYYGIWTPIKVVIWNRKYGRYEREHPAENRPWAFTFVRMIDTFYSRACIAGFGLTAISLAIVLSNIPYPRSPLWEDVGVLVIACTPAMVGLPVLIGGLRNEWAMLSDYNRWVGRNQKLIAASDW